MESENLGVWNTVFAEAFRESGCPAEGSEKDLCWIDTRHTFGVNGYISSTSFTLGDWAFSWLI